MEGEKKKKAGGGRGEPTGGSGEPRGGSEMRGAHGLGAERTAPDATPAAAPETRESAEPRRLSSRSREHRAGSQQGDAPGSLLPPARPGPGCRGRGSLPPPPLLPRGCGAASVSAGVGGSPSPPLPVPAAARSPGSPRSPRPVPDTAPPPRPPVVSPSQMLKVPAVLCVCAAAWCSQALAAAAAVAAAGGRSDGGNFLDDKQWLTTISQYDQEVGQWNKFRDVSAAHPLPRRTGRARAAAAGSGRARGSVCPAAGWQEPPRCPAAGKLAVPLPPPDRCSGKGRRARGPGVQVSPGSHRPVPLPLRPRQVCQVPARPAQLFRGVSGTSLHGGCALAMHCHESN